MGFVKLGTTLELLQWNATYDVSDKRFGELLKLLKKILPKDSETACLPSKIGGAEDTCMSQ